MKGRLKQGNYTTGLTFQEFRILMRLSRNFVVTFTEDLIYDEVYSTGGLLPYNHITRRTIRNRRKLPKKQFMEFAKKTFSKKCNHVGSIVVRREKGIKCTKCNKIF